MRVWMRALVFCVILMPSLASAAYQDPEVESIQNDANGLVRINVVFRGNAGEPDVRMPYTVRAGTTLRNVREWAKEIIDNLDAIRSAAALPALQPGSSIPRVNRINPARAAREIWEEKLNRYLRIKDAGITAGASELAAIKADLEATYQAGFLAP